MMSFLSVPLFPSDRKGADSTEIQGTWRSLGVVATAPPAPQSPDSAPRSHDAPPRSGTPKPLEALGGTEARRLFDASQKEGLYGRYK